MSVSTLCRVLRSKTLQNLPKCMMTAARNFPVCTVDTNLSKDQIPGTFVKDFSHVLANTLDKDEKVVSVAVRPEHALCRSGNTDPMVVIQIWSIGVFDPKRNPGYAKDFFEFIMPQLNVPPERITMLFHPIEKHYAGHLLFEEAETASHEVEYYPL